METRHSTSASEWNGMEARHSTGASEWNGMEARHSTSASEWNGMETRHSTSASEWNGMEARHSTSASEWNGIEISQNPVYDTPYRLSLSYEEPNIPHFIEATLDADFNGRGQFLTTPINRETVSVSTVPLVKDHAPEKVGFNSTRLILVCLCVSVTVCAVMALSALGVTLYTLTHRVRMLEQTNQRLSEQLQAQSTVLGAQLVGGANTTDQEVGVSALNALQNLNTSISLMEDAVSRHRTVLQSEIQQLNVTISSQSNTNEILQELNTSITELGSKVNQSANPFSNCTLERTSCSVGGIGADIYYHQCFRNGQDMYRVGFYTVDVRCEYSSDTELFVSTHLQYSEDRVYCFCDVIHPNNQTGTLQTLPLTTQFSCDLVIDRCPIS